jgi:hypothetical protein
LRAAKSRLIERLYFASLEDWSVPALAIERLE